MFLGAAAVAGVLATPIFGQDWTLNLSQQPLLFSPQCPTTGASSCHNTTEVANLCCFEYPGFWDTSPSTGPKNSWTIHGLWPDNCDGSFEQNCDPSRKYTHIDTLLTENGASDTLAFMRKYWVDIDGKNEHFWEHEWATHGTCLSTLGVDCLPDGSPEGAEAVAFFQTVVQLFKTLPTYTWLENAGILPSNSRRFALSQLIAALKRGSGGFTPALTCTHSGTLNSISWYFNLKGSVIDGVFIPINAPQGGNCPSSGIKYPPKS